MKVRTFAVFFYRFIKQLAPSIYSSEKVSLVNEVKRFTRRSLISLNLWSLQRIWEITCRKCVKFLVIFASLLTLKRTLPQRNSSVITSATNIKCGYICTSFWGNTATNFATPGNGHCLYCNYKIYIKASVPYGSISFPMLSFPMSGAVQMYPRFKGKCDTS